MSGISKLLELRKDSDTESQSSYETVPEEFTYEKDCSTKLSIESDLDFMNEKNNNDSGLDLSPGITFCAGSDSSYFHDYDLPPREVSNVVEQITVVRPTLHVTTPKKLKPVSSKEHLRYVEPDAQLDFVGSELLKKFDLAPRDINDSDLTENTYKPDYFTDVLTTDLDEVEPLDKKSRTARSSASDDTSSLPFLEIDPQLNFLQSELLQRLQLVRMDSSKSDSDDNEEKPNFERSKSDQLERIVEEETEAQDGNAAIIKEILKLEQSQAIKPNIVAGKEHLEYPKVGTVRTCDAVLQTATSDNKKTLKVDNERPKSLTTSVDSDSSLVINSGLSDDEEYHRIMAMSDFTPEDSGSALTNLVPGSDIESEDSLPFIHTGDVKSRPQLSKKQLHI